jgi:hypothetical protein
MYNQNPNPVGIGRVFSRGWDLAIRTLPNAGALIIAVYLPMIVILGMLVRNIFFTLGEAMRNPGAFNENDPQAVTHMMLPLIGSYFSIWLVSLLFQFLIPYVSTAAIMANWDEANDREATISDLLRRAIRRPFWYILVQGILMGVIVGGAYAILMLVGVVLGMVTHGIGFVIAPLALMVGLVYYGVATCVARHEIIAADRGPWKSLISSINLVKGNWGRAFVVMAVVMGITYLLLLPISIPIILKVIDVIPTLQDYPKDDPRAVAQFFGVFSGLFSPWLMAVIGILSAAGTHFFTSVLTALYVELRAAHTESEFEDEWGTDVAGEVGV